MDNAWLVLGSRVRKPAPPSPSRAEQAALEVGSTAGRQHASLAANTLFPD